jgi:hypothetical protein
VLRFAELRATASTSGFSEIDSERTNSNVTVPQKL